jgi:hypothetical protein
MTVVLIDRNIVSDIKKHNSGSGVVQIAFARNADKRGNFVSPLLSIIEGSLKSPQTKDQMFDCLVEESDALNAFYRNARTDSVYLKRSAFELVEAFSEQTEKDYRRYAQLVTFLQGRLANPVAKDQGKKVRGEVLEFVQDHYLYPGHPIVICGIAYVHGNECAQKVLKPHANPKDGKDKHAYNALLDLLKPTQLAYIRDSLNREKHWSRVGLLTRDAGLQEFLSLFRASVKIRSENARAHAEFVEYACILKRELFPYLDQAGYEKLQRDLADAEAKATPKRLKVKPLLRAMFELP